MEYKKCHICGKEFKVSPSHAVKRKCCSKECQHKAVIGTKRPDRTEWMKELGKLNLQGKERDNQNWKGDNATYSAIHDWIRRKLGKANKCEQCGKTKGKIEWSNKNHLYKREISDWQQLCVSCHKIYDIQYNNSGS